MNYKKMTKPELINELNSLKFKLEVAGVSGKYKDTTGHKQVESVLKARIRQQEIVVCLGHKALHDGGLIPLMNEAVKAIADILDNEYCKILELMPDGKTFLLRAGVGWKKGLVGHAKVSAGSDSQSGYTLQASKPVIVDDMKTEKRFSGPLLLHEHNVVSGMSVVILGQKGPWGVLGTYTTSHKSYSKDDINLLKAVANIMADVIVRNEAEETLRESEEKYRRLVESANDSIFVADAETGIIIDVNKRAEQMIGLPAEKIIGMHQALLHLPEEAGHYKRIFEDYINIGGTISNDLFAFNKDGKKIPVEISVSVTEMKGRKIIQGIFRDITERKRAEDEIRKLTHAIEQSASTVVITDVKGVIEYVNPKFTQLTGYTAEESIGRNPRFLKTDKTSPKEYNRLWKTIKSGSEWRGEFCNKKKNGELYWEFVSISPVKNKEGVITNFIAIKEDITKCKKAEKLLMAQYLVTQVLAESITPKDAFSKILQTICTVLEWDIGEIWMIDQQEKVLRNTVIWHLPSLKIPEFKAITKQITFPLQSGLPGRVWKSAKPLWIEDVVSDTNFRRASVAAKEGVHGAFGFPIITGSEVLGTINFYSHELKSPDKFLLNMMSAIGIQIGLYIKRKQADELLHVQKVALEQKTIALQEILGQIEIEKKQIKDNVIANAENLLLPIIQKLRLAGESRKYVQLLRENLQELTSSFGARLTEKKTRLTSREIEVCNMIKNGLTSKEIAGLLNISSLTIEKHRINIRRKSGIINKDINLTSYLKTL